MGGRGADRSADVFTCPFSLRHSHHSSSPPACHSLRLCAWLNVLCRLEINLFISYFIEKAHFRPDCVPRLSPICVFVIFPLSVSCIGMDDKQVLNIWKCLFAELNPLLMGALKGTHRAFYERSCRGIRKWCKTKPIHQINACALKRIERFCGAGGGLGCAQRGKNDIGFSYQVRYTWSSCDSGWEQLCRATAD